MLLITPNPFTLDFVLNTLIIAAGEKGQEKHKYYRDPAKTDFGNSKSKGKAFSAARPFGILDL